MVFESFEAETLNLSNMQSFQKISHNLDFKDYWIVIEVIGLSVLEISQTFTVK